MDLYLPEDFIPHADYGWTDSLHTAHAREEGIGLAADAAENWLGGEALLTPTLQHDLRTTHERYNQLYATVLATDTSDWCAL